MRQPVCIFRIDNLCSLSSDIPGRGDRREPISIRVYAGGSCGADRVFRSGSMAPL
jgi:hypothetical protein